MSNKSVCLLCVSGLVSKGGEVRDHFCTNPQSPKHNKPVTYLTSCSRAALVDRKLPLRGKLAILAQGLANWLGGRYD